MGNIVLVRQSNKQREVISDKRLKFAILADSGANFINVLACGLQGMLDKLDCSSTIFPRGVNLLKREKRRGVHRLSRKISLRNLLVSLEKFDAIIVIDCIPTAFLKSFQIESLRQAFPDKPIVLYSNYYLPTRGRWNVWLKNGNKEMGVTEPGYGMGRYDWYLCSSVVNKYPIVDDRRPYSLIGLNIHYQHDLFPEQNEFIALVDFQRDRFLKERQTQLGALKECNIEFVELKGRYSIEEIRKIYRRTSIYFVAHPESFGVPICELQACGAYVCAPFADWCRSHTIKTDLETYAPGTLTENFVIYEDDKEKLIHQLNRIRQTHNPSAVVKTFECNHPQLAHGDLEQLSDFIEKIERREIHSQSHMNYDDFNVFLPRC